MGKGKGHIGRTGPLGCQPCQPDARRYMKTGGRLPPRQSPASQAQALWTWICPPEPYTCLLASNGLESTLNKSLIQPHYIVASATTNSDVRDVAAFWEVAMRSIACSHGHLTCTNPCTPMWWSCPCLCLFMCVHSAKKTNRTREPRLEGTWRRLLTSLKGRPRGGIPLCALFLETLYTACLWKYSLSVLY